MQKVSVTTAIINMVGIKLLGIASIRFFMLEECATTAISIDITRYKFFDKIDQKRSTEVSLRGPRYRNESNSNC